MYFNTWRPGSVVRNASHLPLKWDPEPFVAAIVDGGKGSIIIPHPSPEEPGARLFVAASISMTMFGRGVVYTLSPNPTTASVWHNLAAAASEVFLVVEPDNLSDVYLLGAAMQTLFLFGKLGDCPHYDMFQKSLSKLVSSV